MAFMMLSTLIFRTLIVHCPPYIEGRRVPPHLRSRTAKNLHSIGTMTTYILATHLLVGLFYLEKMLIFGDHVYVVQHQGDAIPFTLVVVTITIQIVSAHAIAGGALHQMVTDDNIKISMSFTAIILANLAWPWYFY
ncbi:hypothetical protein F4781DRAFT_350266 [Annulohypoxylon bovei var. microspora]|nr:hypothetical protein F4781DRAFT_350266 [Annulohypoxylon bovei var. microspora]